MRIVVDVLRAEQSWDLGTHTQQNYLVVEVFGIETRVPCSEEELVRALSEAGGAVEPDPRDDDDVPFAAPAEDVPVEAPSTFVGARDDEFEDYGEPSIVPPRRRKLAAVRRQRGDDAGIAQG